MSQQTADQSQHDRKNNTEKCGCGDTFSHAFFVFCTASLTKTDPESTRESIDKTEYKINNDTGSTDCSERVSTKSLADDHRVSECIKKLEQISENDRNSKF